MMSRVVRVDPARWQLPAPMQQGSPVVGDPHGAGVWFWREGRDDSELINVRSVAPVTIHRWTFDFRGVVAEIVYGLGAMTRLGASTVLVAYGRSIVRIDTATGRVVDVLSVPHPPGRRDTTKLAPREVVERQSIRTLAAHHFGDVVAVASEYAAAVQIVDLASPDKPVEIALPGSTTAFATTWLADGTLVVTMSDPDGQPGASNVLLVRPNGSIQRPDWHAPAILYAGDRLLTGNQMTGEIHILSLDGPARTVRLQHVSEARPYGGGFGATSRMIALGYRDRSLAVFDWDGVQRAVVPFPRQPPAFSTKGPLPPFASPHVDDVVGDGIGQLWYVTARPNELCVLPSDLVPPAG